MTRTPRWHRSGWLPKLEEAAWPRLERHREAHEAAIEALDAAQEPKARTEAMLEVCNVVEAAFADLRAHFAEGEAAISAARRSVTTRPEPNPAPASDSRAKRENASRIASRPRLLRVRSDWEAMSALLNGVLDAGEVLLDAEVLPAVRAQVAETRAGLEPVAEATGEPDAAKVPEAAAA